MALEAINGTESIVGVLNSGVTTVDRSLLSNRNNIQIEALKQLEQGFAWKSIDCRAPDESVPYIAIEPPDGKKYVCNKLVN